MHTPINPFKQALRERRQQIGPWLGLAHPTAAEIGAGAGFDWPPIDGEHAREANEQVCLLVPAETREALHCRALGAVLGAVGPDAPVAAARSVD